MKRFSYLILALIILSSHDMFLKLDSFHLETNKAASLHMYNGTFDRSDNAITRDRMVDVSIVGHGQRSPQPDSMWTDVGTTTVLNFLSGDPGTYVAGVSTAPRSIELSAEDFNGYLEHDGVLDVLENRKSSGTDGDDAIEKYSKHVKAIFQVGDVKTDDWNVNLGYPIEFIPKKNPYDLEVGGKLPVQLLSKGVPLADQLVYLGTESHDHAHDEGDGGHTHDEEQLRTDANGVVIAPINGPGKWYLRTIYMVGSEEEGFTHESNWASLTFEAVNDVQSSHAHEHSHTLPLYIWVIGLIMLGALIYLFVTRRR